MNSTNLLKIVFTTSLLSYLVACSPVGKSTATIEKLGAESSGIIGGDIVNDDDLIAKSTVALIAQVVSKKDKTVSQSTCTGTLLPNNIIITAGHCIPTADPAENMVMIVVLFGTNIEKPTREQQRLVTEVMIHPEYGKTEDRFDVHDLAMIKFSGSVPEGFAPAKLLSDESVLTPGTTVTLAGYGIIKTDGKTTESNRRLNKVDVAIARSVGKHEVVVDQRFGKGACHGDSGGPAFVEINGSLFVWGVTSRGSGKNGVDDCSLFGIYTKIRSEASFVLGAYQQLLAEK